jgi:hypothetical protein
MDKKLNGEISRSLIKGLFDYHEDGYLIWKIRPCRNVKIGDKAGCLIKYKNAYRYVIRINKKNYFASRLIFLWHPGWLPTIVDHENHITIDNRIKNLRDANSSDNNKNRTSRKDSTSKYLGVSITKKYQYCVARIKVDGKNKHLGTFKSEATAALAYNEAASLHFGKFANLNIIV